MKIFITGNPKVGKTTLIKEIALVLKNRGFNISGFITNDIVFEGNRIGFNIFDLVTKEERTFASKRIITPYKFGSYYLNLENLEYIFNKSLERDFDILIIDEIGKMEFYSKYFKEKIFEILKSDAKVLATLHRDFIDKFSEFGKIFILTKEGREKIKNDILMSFKGMI